MPKSLQKWQIIRQKGKLRYILFTGVLCWGVPMFVVTQFILNPHRGGGISTPVNLAPALIWALAGAGFGGTMWFLGERKYRKYLATQRSL